MLVCLVYSYKFNIRVFLQVQSRSNKRIFSIRKESKFLRKHFFTKDSCFWGGIVFFFLFQLVYWMIQWSATAGAIAAAAALHFISCVFQKSVKSWFNDDVDDTMEMAMIMNLSTGRSKVERRNLYELPTHTTHSTWLTYKNVTSRETTVKTDVWPLFTLLIFCEDR